MSINKQGFFKQSGYNEFGAMELLTPLSYSYTPAADTTNICLTGWAVDIAELLATSATNRLRIEIDIEYTGFASTSTAGDFRLYWQGSNYNPETAAWEWSGTNYLASALNSKTSELTTLVDGTSGTYHYNVVATIPASWSDGFTKSYVGVRCNFSNGTGKFTMSNLKVYPDREYGMGKAHLNQEGVLVSNTLIEI